MEQRSPEWFAARLGKITSSRISDMLAGGKGLTKARYAAQLAAERMTGKPARESFKNAAMDHGTQFEPMARMQYEIRNGVMIEPCGFIDHPLLPRCGCSPDGLVGSDGIVEIKCPDTHTFINYKLSGEIPTDYKLQMTWQLACTQRQWADFVVFDPDLPEEDGFLCIRFTPSEESKATLQQSALAFDVEVQLLINSLIEKRRT
jgi:putative phage-type endonuclease